MRDISTACCSRITGPSLPETETVTIFPQSLHGRVAVNDLIRLMNNSVKNISTQLFFVEWAQPKSGAYFCLVAGSSIHLLACNHRQHIGDVMECILMAKRTVWFSIEAYGFFSDKRWFLASQSTVGSKKMDNRGVETCVENPGKPNLAHKNPSGNPSNRMQLSKETNTVKKKYCQVRSGSEKILWNLPQKKSKGKKILVIASSCNLGRLNLEYAVMGIHPNPK